jgi:hypothetical protein
VPSMAMLKNTDLGTADFSAYFPYEHERRASRDGKAVVIPREQWQSLQMQDQFDALIYLGPELSFEEWAWPREKCSDRAYLDMRWRRLEILRPLAGAATDAEIDRLKKSCNI